MKTPEYFSKYKKTILVIIVLLSLVLTPIHSAQAAFGFPCSSIENCLKVGIAWLNYLFLSAAGSIVSAAARVLDEFVRAQPVEGVFVVDAGWSIIRNFVNMFFILILIVIAFGTIFNNQKYNYSILPRLILIAIAINFSLPIGKYIIGFSTSLTHVFLNQIGNLSVDLADGLEIQKFATGAHGFASVADISNRYFSLLATELFAIIFVVIAMFAMLSAAIFAVIRTPILWFLLIISPFAWIGYILPAWKKQSWDRWWEQFICWCFFLPAYVFFMIFAIAFIRAKSQLAGLFPAVATSDNALGNLFGGQNLISDIFFYVLTVIFMVYGLVVAKTIACKAGSGTVKMIGGVENWVKRRGGYYAAKRGLGEKWKEIREEGLKVKGIGIPGERDLRLREAGIAESFGLGAKSLKGERDRAMLNEANKEAELLRRESQTMSLEQRKIFLKKQISTFGVRGNAALLEYAKQGYSEMSDYKQAMARFGGEYTGMGREYLKNIKEAKFSKLFENSDEELALAKDPVVLQRYSELARSLAQDLAEKNRITNEADFKKLRELFEPIPKELRAFMNAIKPEAVYGTRGTRQAALFDPNLDKDLARKLIDFMKDKKEVSAHKEGDVTIHTGLQMRNQVLKILGNGDSAAGENTIEGRNIINEVNKFNPLINIEARVRVDRGLDESAALTDAAKAEIVSKLVTELSTKEIPDVRKMAKDFFEDPLAKQAAREVYTTPDQWSDLFKDAPRALRNAWRDIRAGVTP